MDTPFATSRVSVEAARSRFASPKVYLRTDPHIDLRAELVRDMIGDPMGSILDVGCGDGRISLQFRSASKISLYDLSPAMIEAARVRVPTELLPRVDLSAGSVYDLPGEPRYDVVLGIGLLSHLPDVPKAMAVLAGKLAPRGRLVVQITDFDQPLSHAYVALLKVKRSIFDRSGYQTHQLRQSEIIRTAEACGLVLERERTHWAMPPMTGRLPASVCKRFLRYATHEPWLTRAGTEKLLAFRKA